MPFCWTICHWPQNTPQFLISLLHWSQISFPGVCNEHFFFFICGRFLAISGGQSGSMFHPLSHIYAKTPFCCVETVANNALNCLHVVVFDRLWANAAPTLNTAFSLINVYAKWWIHCLLISSTPLLSLANSIYDWPKRIFWCFPGQLPNLGDLSVQHHLCLYDRV